MPKPRVVTITVVDGVVVCETVKLRLGESVTWNSPPPSTVIVDFGNDSPFDTKAFANGDTATVTKAFSGERRPRITVTSGTTVTVGTDVGGLDFQHT